MKKTFIIIAFVIICISNTFADIAPNPIKAKAILTSGETTIRMASELVVIDLYKDSSVVECKFIMKNEGKKQKLNIGFPEMYFHHWEKASLADYSKKFFVQENGIEIKEVDFYTPKSYSEKERETQINKNKQSYDEQPWYIWDSEFGAGETKEIIVRYSLPYGQIYKGSRFFTYLLSTGSGWMGSIDTVEVIVNIKDFSTDLIVEITPYNYSFEIDQISWKFYNLEPSTKDDIKILYLPSKEYYAKIDTLKTEPTIIFDNEIVSNRFLDKIDPHEILTIHILKDSKDTEKYTVDKEGVILIYTKSYAIDKLKNLIKSKSSDKHLLADDSSSDFIEKYKFLIDETAYEGRELLLKIVELKEDEIQSVIIEKNLIEIKQKK